MFCSISGEIPTDPVLSLKSNFLFEKRLLIKYVSENNADPITGESMTVDDILDVKSSHAGGSSGSSVVPKTPAATSLPTLLLSLQNEWDSVMLESFSLKQSVQTLKLELANALYENDAAKRVIARVVKERDDARQQLLSFKSSVASSYAEEPVKTTAPVEDVEMATEEPTVTGTLSEEVISKIESVQAELSASRKKKKAPESLSSIESISSYNAIARVEEFQRNKAVDVLSIDAITTEEGGERFLVAGKDNSITIVNSQGEKLGSTAKAHSKTITSAIWGATEDSLLTASEDGSVKLWDIEKNKNGTLKIKNKSTWKLHQGSVKLALHPTKEFFVSVGEDGVWSFVDVSKGEVLLKAKNVGGAAFTSVHIHPDGHLLGTGSSDHVLRLWDMKTGAFMHAFEGHVGPVTALEFSENGYIVASSSTAENAVKFWDLRKLVNSQNLEVDTGVKSIRFDKSGVYIATAIENRVLVHVVKKLVPVADYNDLNDVRDVVFGKDATFVVAGSQDSFTVFGQGE